MPTPPAAVILVSVLALVASAFADEARLDMPPRLQWNANGGYCGEVSMISAGLYYGQYCSQFTARQMAAPAAKQSDTASWLLLGVNDLAAAGRMRLAAERFYFPTQASTRDFLVWVKSHVADGYPVIVGLFYNTTRFGDPPPGDEEYDHIVPVVSVGSAQSLADYAWKYFATDTLTFSDNGLYDPAGTPAYFYDTTFSRFAKTRRAANASSAPLYSLKSTPNNYGIAVTGVLDLDGATIPVRLAASRNSEPEMPDGSDTPPRAAPLRLTVTVTIPDTSVPYKLYCYDDFADVPVSSFNANASKASRTWDIPAHAGSSFEVTYDTDTGSTAVFRAVPASAP